MALKLRLGCQKIYASKFLVSLTVRSAVDSRRFSFRAALFTEMAALIKSGYRSYIYIMYEIAGKKVKVYTVPGEKQKDKSKYGGIDLLHKI
jgi:hypothetical protein